jgi:4-amino-4-deoxy-L-arabinose transferase-like glycosyltransferase
VILTLVGVLFLAASWSTITAPFGDSDEGINGAVWGYDSRALVQLGPIESRLGGVRIDRTKYATHPPLIVIETAAMERAVGEHPWSTRAAAWLGALATIPLLYLLVRALALSPVPAACTTAAALACHFFLVYGSMLDTMIIALPFGVAAMLVWYRQWTGQRRWPWWAVLLLATVASLAGWQAMFLIGLCAVALVGRVRSRGRPAIVEALPWAAGAVLGLVLTLAWALWVYGDLGVLDDKLVRRTGGEAASLSGMVSFQLPWLGQLLGLGFLAWIAAAISLRDKRFRPLASLSLIAVIVYAAIFKEGSGGHQYWNYWGLLPAAIGLAYVFSFLDATARRRWPKRVVPRAVALVAVAAVVGAINLSQTNEAKALIDEGIRTYDVVTSTQLAPGQDRIDYVGEPFRLDDWLRYRGGPSGDPIESEAALRELAAAHPDWKVVVLGACADPDPTGVCDRLQHPDGAVRIEPARQLVAELGSS